MAQGKPPRGRRPSRPAAVAPEAREAALRLLVELEAGGAPAGGRLEQFESAIVDPQERALFRSVFTETVRHRLRIDAVLDRCLARTPVAGLTPWIRNLLRLGAAQILLQPGIPDHAAVSTAVALAHRYGHKGTSGLVNAVLRRIARDGADLWREAGREGAAGPSDEPGSDTPAEILSVRHSHPLWLVRRWIERWGAARAEAILRWDNTQPDYWLRVSPARVDAAQAPEDRVDDRGRAGQGVAPGRGRGAADTRDPDAGERRATMPRPGWIPGTLRLPAGSRPAEQAGFLAGEWTVQDGSGILVGHLPPEVEGLVLDLCAAPGTKTGHLCERAAPGARVIALDLSRGRLRRLRRGLERLSLSPELVAADGRRIPVRPPWSGVLLDAPCSNLGVLRRRVDLKWRAREEEIPRLAAVQAALLDAAAAGVVPGGWLVYSVCTVEDEETTWQRDRFLETHPEWEPGALPEAVPPAARRRPGEMFLVPGDLETDGTYAFVVRRAAGPAGGSPREMPPNGF